MHYERLLKQLKGIENNWVLLPLIPQTSGWKKMKKEKRMKRRILSFVASLLFVLFLTAAAYAAPEADQLVAKGKALIEQKKNAEAVTELNAVLTANPQHIEATRLRGVAHRNLKQFDAAIRDFTRVLELDTKSYAGYAGRAMTKREANNIPAAIEDMNAAIRLAPQKEAGRLLISLSYYHLDTGEYPAMLDACSRSKQAAVNAESINCVGRAYLKLGQYDKARQEYDELIQFNGTLSYAYRNRAKAHLELGQLEKAKRDFDKAAELRPDITKFGDVQEDLAKLNALQRGEKPPVAKAAPEAQKPRQAAAPANLALNKEFNEAVAKKDIAGARAALDKGADVNSMAANGFPALLTAAMNVQEEMVAMLLEKGADANGRIYSGYTPLMRAASEGSMKMANALLEKGADVNRRTTSGLSALIGAAGNGRTEIVRMLVDKGAEVNASMSEQGDTALIGAANNGHVETVNVLLERGAVVDMKMKDGTTPLMKAALRGANCLSNCRDAEIVQMLLNKGADPNAKNTKDETVLMLASCAIYADINIVRMLLDRGAKVNANKTDGETILICAAGQGHREVVKLLLERGADPNARKQDGMTAIKLAVKKWGWQADEIVKTLKQAGARE